MKKAGMSETEALHSERRLLPPRVGSLDLEAIGLSLEGRVRPGHFQRRWVAGRLDRWRTWADTKDDCLDHNCLSK